MNDPIGPGFTWRCYTALGDAAEIALGMEHQDIGVEHIFLAIMRDPEAIPAQVLAELADLSTVEARMLEAMKSASYANRS